MYAFRIVLAIAFLIAVCVAAFFVFQWLQAQARTRARWEESTDFDVNEALDSDSPRGWLAGWLFLAGYRIPAAPWYFIGAMVLCTVIGLGSAMFFTLSGLQGVMEQTVVLVPGGVGETFLPVVWVAPWIIAILFICLPITVVRSARRQR